MQYPDVKELTEVPGLKPIFSEFYLVFLPMALSYRYMAHKVLTQDCFPYLDLKEDKSK